MENSSNKRLINKNISSSEKRMEKNPNNIITDYLKKKNFIETLRVFEEEIKKENINYAPLKEIIKNFKEGKIKLFLENWEKIKKVKNKTIPVQENLKLELHIRLYFVIWNSIQNKPAEIEESKQIIKNFLEEKGTEISSNSELIFFFALPYVKNLENHNTFKSFFSEKWMKETKMQLKNYIKETFQKKNILNTELENLLSSLKELKNSSKKLIKEKVNLEESSYKKKMEELNNIKYELKKKTEELKNQKNESKETMKLIHQKWANFVK